MTCASSMSVAGGVDTPGITGVAVALQQIPVAASSNQVTAHSVTNPLEFKSCEEE
jgi:hypothetical protein